MNSTSDNGADDEEYDSTVREERGDGRSQSDMKELFKTSLFIDWDQRSSLVWRGTSS